MIDNNIDTIFSLERVLTTEDRDKLPDSAFGIPKNRTYPLYTKSGKVDEPRLKSAMTYFRHCPEKYRTQLANNILKAIKKTNINYSKKALWYTYTSEYKKNK